MTTYEALIVARELRRWSDLLLDEQRSSERMVDLCVEKGYADTAAIHRSRARALRSIVRRMRNRATRLERGTASG